MGIVPTIDAFTVRLIHYVYNKAYKKFENFIIKQVVVKICDIIYVYIYYLAFRFQRLVSKSVVVNYATPHIISQKLRMGLNILLFSQKKQ